MKIKTSKLKEMVGRVVKGAGNNKLIPVTQMLSIHLEAGELTLCTTDGTNYLYIKESEVEGDDYETVVPVDLFSKLISRMTCDVVTLEQKDTALYVIGNGKYALPIQYEDNGDLINYPNPLAGAKWEKKTAEISKDLVNSILNSVKPALATSFEVPCFMGYYVGEKVVATDSTLINALDTEVFSKARLLSAETVDLLEVITADTIKVKFKDEVVCFETPDCIVYGRDLPGIADFPINQINPYLTEVQFPSYCEVSGNLLLQLLDRLSLFVGVYDKGAISIAFTEEGLQITSMGDNGMETIPYISREGEDASYLIDVLQLTKQVKAQTGETVKIYYGVDNAIKLVDGKVTQIIALKSGEAR